MTESAKAAPEQGRSMVFGLLRDWGLALAVVIAVFAVYNLAFAPSPPALGPAAPFTLSDLEGHAFSLSDVPQDIVVLNFWFTTCPPCRSEIPELSAFHTEHPEIGLYGVSTDMGMPPGRLKRESERLGINYPVLHDTRADVARLYGVDVFPTTLVIHDGRIVAARVGAVDRRSLLALVELAR